jgi:cyclopropane-fatty-acyl-phospholipid synthase
VFFMACAELFGCDHGNEWLVGHYTMRRNRA